MVTKIEKKNLCTMVIILTFMVGGVRRRDKMTNSGKLDHSGILKNQRIYLIKVTDLISNSQELSFIF